MYNISQKLHKAISRPIVILLLQIISFVLHCRENAVGLCSLVHSCASLGTFNGVGDACYISETHAGAFYDRQFPHESYSHVLTES